MNDFDRVANDLEQMPAAAVRQGRGITARHVDRAADDARAKALSEWTTYGRGMAGSAGTIRGRMSADRSEVIGYVLADGEGVFQAEHGSGHRAPTAVIRSSVDAAIDPWVADVADMLGGL